MALLPSAVVPVSPLLCCPRLANPLRSSTAGRWSLSLPPSPPSSRQRRVGGRAMRSCRATHPPPTAAGNPYHTHICPAPCSRRLTTPRRAAQDAGAAWASGDEVGGVEVEDAAGRRGTRSRRGADSGGGDAFLPARGCELASPYGLRRGRRVVHGGRRGHPRLWSGGRGGAGGSSTTTDGWGCGRGGCWRGWRDDSGTGRGWKEEVGLFP
eukprot:133866-Chlamydomonas_euryale.AAC.1